MKIKKEHNWVEVVLEKAEKEYKKENNPLTLIQELKLVKWPDKPLKPK